MDFQILRRFYSNVHANIYYLRLKDAGINCFMSNENISSILPLSDGGVMLHVEESQFEEALNVVHIIDEELKSADTDVDHRDATKEDIRYEKEVNQYNQWLNSKTIDMTTIRAVLFVLFVITILLIVINYFVPFKLVD